jgi:hypothetical protein
MSVKRSDGEKVRLAHVLDRMRAMLESFYVPKTGPIGQDVAQAIQLTANEFASIIAKHDAYELAERDGYKREPVCKMCNDTHRFPHSGNMCTSCPTPCPRCRSGKIGAYCEETPCACDCHGKKAR